MKFKKIGNKFFIKIEKGGEIVATLKKFCQEQNIKLGTITGLGATDEITVGLFETKNKEYHSKTFTGDFEIVSFTGNITTLKDDVYLHIHAAFSDAQYNCFGGHLNSAVVSATFEAVIIPVDGRVEREFSDSIGLNLFKL